MSVYHVATSPITNTIFAGKLVKSGKMWATGKTDVTVEALVSVAEHALRFGSPVIVYEGDGTPLYKITVEKLKQDGRAI